MSRDEWSELRIPMLEGKDPVTVRGQFPVSAANLDHMITVLGAMRPAVLTAEALLVEGRTGGTT